MSTPPTDQLDPNGLPPRPAEGHTIQQIIAGTKKPLDKATVTPPNPFSSGRHN